MRGVVEVFVVFLLYKNVDSIDPLVQTDLGLIRGILATDGDYSSFLGIPYATVNESNPFGPAIPHPGFQDVFDANDDSQACIQFDAFPNAVIGTMDCLQLHIHVPSSAHAGNLLPVLVFIHGGGFSGGNGARAMNGPRYFLRHDVIFVSINYRVGVYGFMCLQTPELPGNEGLKDQLMALRWINRHIEAFGGDVNRITISGESAGAMSVDAHLISDKERLFSGAIMSSGTSLIPDVGRDPNPNTPIDLAGLLGFSTNDVTEALSFLSSANPVEVVAATRNPLIPAFFPCVEREIQGVEPFLLEHPLNIAIPKARDTAILIGFNSDECVACGGPSRPVHVDGIIDYLGYLSVGFNFTDQELRKAVRLMTRFYLGDEGPVLNEEAQLKLVDFESDVKFVWPAERSVSKYIENGAEEVYFYQFNYDGGRNLMKVMSNITFPGAIHADDLGYWFHMSVASMPEPPLPEDQLIIDRLTTMWTNFVKYGNPTPEVTELLPIKWEPVVRGSPHYFLNIDTELTIGRRPYHNRTAFWDLFYKHNMKSHISNRPNTA